MPNTIPEKFKKCLTCPDFCNGCRKLDLSSEPSSVSRAVLKAAKIKVGATNQAIADGCVPKQSLATVNNFFSDKETDVRHDTMYPIHRYLLGYDPELICGDRHDLQEQIRTLTAANAELTAQVTDLKESREAAINAAVDKAKAEDQRKVDFLKDELAVYRRHGLRWRRISTACVSFVIALLLAISVVLVIDKASPKWGIFWRDDVSSVFGSTTEEPFAN